MTDKPTMEQDANTLRFPAFDAVVKPSVASTGIAADLSAATTRLKYLSGTESFFYSKTGTAVATAGGTSFYVAAGIVYPVVLDSGQVISVISAGTDGIVTHADMG